MDRQAFTRRQAQGGIAMVEFVITLPLLLLLLFAIGEFGRLLFQYNSLLQASRDAGRYAAGEAWNARLGRVELSTDLQTQIQNLAASGVASAQVVSCSPDPSAKLVPKLCPGNVTVTPVGTDHVQVTIRYTFLPLIGSGIPAFIGDATGLNFPLVATTVMRAL
ncbi:TadE/TadG family type IV pilus assembly protein [Pseudomonas sp. UBA2684]|uniref:TadE/TadG family type IV pilus assembly protein n=1 Tax=Pseudomonas sp. UBA2684 TaxID=1947311 RepID=UPI000E9970DC|nr:TadE/TadG family type IV pilus assembly protein [Pseudomonas sp. UBA2684]HBX56582.1 pilus assembly protein TadG [Pseudomonas sp.]|tara:strand:+ start:157 stop:645 length:489 start_codon:yes stop_codon:yes gene_type:complete